MTPSFLVFFTSYLGELFRSSREDKVFQRRDVRMVILRQLKFTGAQSFRLVGIAALFVGIMTVAQSTAQLQRFGGGNALGPLLVAAIIRELGPLLTTLIVVSRSVSAVASELSSMKANGEIELLQSVGVSPLSYLVIPRVLGGAFSVFLLCIHFVAVALVSGFIFGQLFVSMPLSKFVLDILHTLSPIDVVIFTLKSLGAGFGIFLLATFVGLRTSGRSYEVPQATTQAVVYSFLVTFAFQAFTSLFYYFVILDFSFGGIGL